MSTLSGIINISLSGLKTYQTALSITGTNIANVSAEGYSRQTTIIQESRDGTSTAGWTSGSGVQVADVKRIYDQFCNKMLRQSQSELGTYQTQLKYLEYVEADFNESETDGLSTYLSDFWNAWQDLANDPTDYTARTSLVSQASTLAEAFNQTAGDLKEIQKELNQEISTSVDQINDLTTQIAKLNQQVQQAKSTGQSTNSLLDDLDTLTNELSALIDIQTSQDDTGQVSIQLADGKSLVEGTKTWTLGTEVNSSIGNIDITWSNGSGTKTVVNETITGGSVGGCLTVRDDYISSYLENLDDLAGTIISQVNSLLESGYDLNGDAGVDLFTGDSADDISVNQALLDDPNKIAASSISSSSSGDGSIAQAIAQLQSTALMNSSATTCDDFYASLVSQVGLDVQAIDSQYEQQESLSTFYTNYRESISGVSTDEEAANLVIYQQAYEACAKSITVLQEIMQTLIDM